MQTQNNAAAIAGIFSLPVLAAAFGYFVDLYDIIIFSAVRAQSLADMGVPADQSMTIGLSIINAQMVGTILGGFLFGMAGDKFGRRPIMFLSIITYSLATLLCAFVQDVETYKWLRFIAGLGIAGELGLGITLVSELLGQQKRGLGCGVIAAIGVLGGAAAGVAALYMPWRECYMLGGALGLLLMFFRMGVWESGLFEKMRGGASEAGNLLMLFGSRDRLWRLLLIVLTGMPIIFVIWFFSFFAPEFTASLGLSTPMSAGEAIIITYLGLSVGDAACAFVSQKLQSRKKAMLLYQTLSIIACLIFLWMPHPDSHFHFQLLYLMLGIVGGYWVIMAVAAAEKFGTNLRATVATATPNLVRSTIVPIGFFVSYLKADYGLANAGLIVGAAIFALSIAANLSLKETFHRDLDYLEKA